MRIRATVAAVSGALALSALAVPAAQADGGWGDTTITKVVVDGDNKVSMGISDSKTIKVSVTANDDSGILRADAFDLTGPDWGYFTTGRASCTAVSSTTSTCSASVLVDPRSTTSPTPVPAPGTSAPGSTPRTTTTCGRRRPAPSSSSVPRS